MELINLEINNQIAVVSFNRPEKHNALDMEMFYAIVRTINQLKKDKSVRVVIVKGNGASFCSGLDIKSVLSKKLNNLKLLWKWLPWQPNLAQRVSYGWRQLKVPVIMAIHGNCLGGGMQIALGGDFRIVHPDTKLSIMEAKWGLIPDMAGTPALKENMPLDQAMLLAMTAGEISAKQALEAELITSIENDPFQAAMNLAEKLKSRSPDTNRIIKRMYHQIWCKKAGNILAKETFNQWKVILGKNQKIAVKKQLGQDVDYQ